MESASSCCRRRSFPAGGGGPEPPGAGESAPAVGAASEPARARAARESSARAAARAERDCSAWRRLGLAPRAPHFGEPGLNQHILLHGRPRVRYLAGGQVRRIVVQPLWQPFTSSVADGIQRQVRIPHHPVEEMDHRRAVLIEQKAKTRSGITGSAQRGNLPKNGPTNEGYSPLRERSISRRIASRGDTRECSISNICWEIGISTP